MDTDSIQLNRSQGQLTLSFGGAPLVVDLGAGIPSNGRWWWSFPCGKDQGSLRPTEEVSETGSDQYGDYQAVNLTYNDDAGPLVRLRLRTYSDQSYLIVETTALRDLTGTFVEDSFFHTTFNSPVVRLADGLSFLTYTWGLQGREGTGIGGYFPDGVLAPDLDRLPEQLRRSGFSPTTDIHQTPEKPFAPLIAYDGQERTLVMSPLDHFLISPMRLMDTPGGAGIARGLHGAVDAIPRGLSTQTVMVFGRGVVATVLKWGDLLMHRAGDIQDGRQESTLVNKLGFWNCYGSYYAELFRQTNEDTLLELASYFKAAEIPVSYIGLDLWYHFRQVGFARDYRPDPAKYSRGLKPIIQETGLPMLLHMSAFDADTAHRESYEFVVDEGSAYPATADFYRDRAREYRDWGALGIWPDFLRTQLQNSRSLRAQIGVADGWFRGLCQAMAQEGLDIMLCMPTVGHYLASIHHPNVNTVRTSTDYVNHQPGQLEILRRTVEEYRYPNTSQHNLRQNLLLSLLAGALGLAPSYDVFITNRNHPEGFADSEAPKQALARALSAGIVGIGDKAGEVDRDIVDRLAFPDGTLPQPDHPPYPVVATLGSEAPAFYTTTTVGGFTWTYIALYNLAEGAQEYLVDLESVLELSHRAPAATGNSPPTPLYQRGEEEGILIYDYLAGQSMDLAGTHSRAPLRGKLEPGDYRYLVIPPRVGNLYLLGFLDKYVPVSRRQVKGVSLDGRRVAVDLELPAGRSYSFMVAGAEGLTAEGQGLSGLEVQRREGLDYVTFRVDAPRCRLVLGQ